MPKTENMIEDILAIVAEQFPDSRGSLNSDSDLYDLGLDSTSAIELMVALETKFGIAFPDSLIDESTFATPAMLHRAIVSVLS